MKMWMVTGGLLSVDSLVVMLALSPLMKSRSQALCLAALFGACDGFAILLGAWIHGVEPGDTFSRMGVPCFILALGVYCLVAARWDKFRADPRLAFALPPLMSFDNLAYGVGTASVPLEAIQRAAVLGASSFAAALLGLLIGNSFRLPTPQARERFAGFALVLMGFLVHFLT